MLSNLFIHKIQIIRFASTGQDDLGEFTSSSRFLSTPPYIPARIESNKAKEEYRDSNGRPINTTLIYIPIQYILQVNDDIYDKTAGANVYIGKVIGVNPALRAFTTVLDHYEIIVENP